VPRLLFSTLRDEDVSADSAAVKLQAHFLLWMTSPEAKFLKGRSVWCNWDVDQLKAKAKELEESPQLLTSNILGWPYQP